MRPIPAPRCNESIGRVAVLGALALTLAVTFVAAPADAQVKRAGSPDLGLFLGYHTLNADNELGNAASGTHAPTNAVMIGARGGLYLSEKLAAELELDYEASSFRNSGESVGIFGWRAALRYHFLDAVVRPFAHLAVGSLGLLGHEEGRTIGDVDAHYSLGVGGIYDLSPTIGVRGDLRYVLVPGNESKMTHDFMFLIGIAWAPGATIPDSDGDGINDRDDKCPNEPEDLDGFADVDGCPELDNDGDGIPDGADRCPMQAETRNGYRDDDGCPDADADGDGIPDADDKCPKVAEDKDGFQDDDGCPEPDNDRDGVADGSDKCPNQAEDKDGFEDDDGCPDPDNDKDGILDGADKCPNEPETPNGFEDEDGCPDKVPEKVAKSFAGTMEGIVFDTGKATIRKTSFKVLDKAVALLKEFPSVRIEVSGHTDNVGKTEDNHALSQSRADAVKAYLVSQGIDAARVVAKGYGDERPVADNAKKAGRAKNRRIEFQVITGR